MSCCDFEDEPRTVKLVAGHSDEADSVVCLEIGDDPMTVFVDLTIDEANEWIDRLRTATLACSRRRAAELAKPRDGGR